jgi:nucleoside-diphosphate kinase
MTQEYTFSMIKPDATKRNLIGKINSYLENNGLKIVAQRMTTLSKEQAQDFYAEHSSRVFFNSLIESITSGPVVLQVLKGDDAIIKNRKIMGATNPSDAEIGTIRKDFAKNIESNSIHGSDSLKNAQREINFFFTTEEIVE